MMTPPFIRPAVPVIPGPQGATVSTINTPPCVACDDATPRRAGSPPLRKLVDVIGAGKFDDYIMLCVDVRACCLRARSKKIGAYS